MKKGERVKVLKITEKDEFYHARIRSPKGVTTCRTPEWAQKAANSIIKGAKVVTCQKKGKWEIQKVLIPVKDNTKGQAEVYAREIVALIERRKMAKGGKVIGKDRYYIEFMGTNMPSIKAFGEFYGEDFSLEGSDALDKARKIADELAKEVPEGEVIAELSVYDILLIPAYKREKMEGLDDLLNEISKDHEITNIKFISKGEHSIEETTRKFAQGGKVGGGFRSVKVTYADGTVIPTSMSSRLTDEEIYDYFAIGKVFNIGTAEDNLQEVVKVEILKEKGGKVSDKPGIYPLSYKGKAASTVWSKWNADQRSHFLHDHAPDLTKETVASHTTKSFGKLPKYVQNLIQVHVKHARYEKGGKVDDSDTPKVYVADLAAYNEGKLIGEWIDLSDYSDGEEVMEAISGLLKKWSKEQGVTREEYAIHDYENIPEFMYSEYMGEEGFDDVVKWYEAIDELDTTPGILGGFIDHHGFDNMDATKESFEERYAGTYNSQRDHAYQLVDDFGITGFTDFERYLFVSDTDKRLYAQEEADHRVEDMEDEDILSESDLEDVDEAREELRERYYEETYEALKRDPYDYLVNEQGIYSPEDFSKATFVQVDYDKLSEALEQDYLYVEDKDGSVAVFDNMYKKGGRVPGGEKQKRQKNINLLVKHKYELVHLQQLIDKGFDPEIGRVGPHRWKFGHFELYKPNFLDPRYRVRYV